MKQNTVLKTNNTAVVLMIINGVLVLIQLIYGGIVMFFSQHISIFLFILYKAEALLIAFLFILFAYFLKRGKKWAWIASLILLLKEIVVGIRSMPTFLGWISQIRNYPEYVKINMLLKINIVSFVTIYILILTTLILLFLEKGSDAKK